MIADYKKEERMRRAFIIYWDTPHFDAFFTELKLEQAINSRLRVDSYSPLKVNVRVMTTVDTFISEITDLTDSEISQLFDKTYHYQDDTHVPLPSIVKKLVNEYRRTHKPYTAKQRRILDQIFFTHELKIKPKQGDQNNESTESSS